jgi:hypothetical protein
MNIYRVRVYPYSDDGDPVEFLFTDPKEAQALADHIMSLPEDDSRFLSGATGSVGPFLRPTVSYAEALADLVEMYGAACRHPGVELEDDGLAGSWFACIDCGNELVLSEPDEDGNSVWEVVP